MDKRPGRAARRAEYLFGLYLALGPRRSLNKLAEFVAKVGLAASYKTLKRYSADFGWQEKARDMDKKLGPVWAGEGMAAAASMCRLQAEMGRLLQNLGKEALDNLDATELTPSDVVHFIEAGVRIQRLALGEVTDRTELVVHAVNNVVVGIVAVFRETVRGLSDAETLTERFALGAQRVIDGQLANITPTGDGGGGTRGGL